MCRRSARQSTTADRGTVLEAGLFRLREIEGMDGEDQARRRHRGLQRPCLGVLGRDHSDLRARLRGRVSARRRRLGAAAGAGREGPSRACRAYRPVGHSRRVRPHHRQQDGGRSRPHRAAEPDVRLAQGVAVPGHPARRQRGAVSAADGASLLHARQGDPQGGRVLPGGSAGRDLRHRRHVAPDQRPARRPDQQQVRQGLSRQPHQGSREAHAHPASRIHARGRRRGHRDGDVADHARRARRRRRGGLPLLSRAGLQHRGRPHHPGEQAARRPQEQAAAASGQAANGRQGHAANGRQAIGCRQAQARGRARQSPNVRRGKR